MAWCHQATSHYLSQYWPRSMSSYGIVRPYWVNLYGNLLVKRLYQAEGQHMTWWHNSMEMFSTSMAFCDENHWSQVDTHNLQSGTKPNLVAKMWPLTLGTICAWLPKLIADVISQFHHSVNTGLNVGSLVKWLPIMVAHTCKLDTIWVVYIANWKWLHPILIAFNTLCPVQFYIHWCVALHWTHWGSYFEKFICSCFIIRLILKIILKTLYI